jgi:hypothetical protein
MQPTSIPMGCDPAGTAPEHGGLAGHAQACVVPGPLGTTAGAQQPLELQQARLPAQHSTIVPLAISSSRCGMDMLMSGKQ